MNGILDSSSLKASISPQMPWPGIPATYGTPYSLRMRAMTCPPLSLGMRCPFRDRCRTSCQRHRGVTETTVDASLRGILPASIDSFCAEAEVSASHSARPRSDQPDGDDGPG